MAVSRVVLKIGYINRHGLKFAAHLKYSKKVSGALLYL